MYDRVVAVPRLTAPLPAKGRAASLIRRVASTLSAYYRRSLTSIALAYYRDGRDSVAPHGDKMGSLAGDTVIAILSVGSPRRFTLRALDGKASRGFQLGWGDLLVLGGSCQKTFLHGVPKVARAAPRISIQFREALPDAEGERLSSGLRFSRTVARSFASS
jgi:alkylated DNA repair dioxygenase AlkB